MRVPVPEQVVLALGVVLALLAMAALFALRRWWRSLRARFKGRHVHRREEAARVVLERDGFEIEGAQVRRTWSVTCDGEELPIELRADYLVRRDGRRFVADVKTGARATRVTTAATRRQLLEYQLAYEVSGVLLIDMDAERIREVAFDLSA